MRLNLFIRLTLVLPFLLAGIGLFEVVHLFIGEDTSLPKEYVIWGLVFGTIIWYAETQIIIDFIKKFTED